MQDNKKIYWEFESEDAFYIRISGTLEGVSLMYHLRGVYNDHPVSADDIVRAVRFLEPALVEAAEAPWLTEHRKELVEAVEAAAHTEPAE